ncbi:MAG: AI-2E family transporter [Methylotenera sp. RIFCSPLOWO2_02_FULL_45_14]|nr:MAG: AI-2E family transporter [Methylotenera sp. RIFCSPLOWO2_02_FULL_45_14]
MKDHTPFSRRIVPWLALGGLLLLAFMVVTPFLAPIAWAGVLAYASWPAATSIRRWCNNRDSLAASLSTALAALTLFLPLIWLAWLAQQELSNAYPALQAFLANPPPVPEALRGLPWLGDWLVHQQATLVANPQGVSSVIKAWLAAHTNDLTILAGGVGKNLAKLIFVIVILFFFYRDGARIVRELRHVLERFIGAQVHDYLHAVGTTARAVVYGILLTALVQGIVAGLGYRVAGLASPVMFGVLTMILALIPFGTPLAWGAAGFWLLLQGETGAAIGVWIWGAMVVSQLDNFLRPLFISSVSPIPFLFVLFGVLGGLLAFGLVGLFVGPIVLAVIWAVWREWVAHLEEEITVE